MIDLQSVKYGNLTAISRSDRVSGPHYYWLCRCDCGSIIEVLACNLRSGNTQSCGKCIRPSNDVPDHLRFEMFQRFGYLFISDDLPVIKPRVGLSYFVRCACGKGRGATGFYVAASRLLSGQSWSCGDCLKNNKPWQEWYSRYTVPILVRSDYQAGTLGNLLVNQDRGFMSCKSDRRLILEVNPYAVEKLKELPWYHGMLDGGYIK